MLVPQRTGSPSDEFRGQMFKARATESQARREGWIDVIKFKQNVFQYRKTSILQGQERIINLSAEFLHGRH
jgi:hypothetical protein